MCDIEGTEKDTHTCELKFGSWVYNANQLDLISVSIVCLCLSVCMYVCVNSIIVCGARQSVKTAVSGAWSQDNQDFKLHRLVKTFRILPQTCNHFLHF